MLEEISLKDLEGICYATEPHIPDSRSLAEIIRAAFEEEYGKEDLTPEVS